MKLFIKIFLCTVAIITAAISATGYTVISRSFKTAMAREYENVSAEYQLLKFALQSGMLSNSGSGRLSDEALASAATQTSSAVWGDTQVAVFDENGSIVFSTFPSDFVFPDMMESGAGRVDYSVLKEEDAHRLYAKSSFEQSGRTATLLSAKNITALFEDKRSSEKSFLAAFVIAEAIGSAFAAGFAYYITRPIERLARSTRAFAGGRHDERAIVKSRDEIGELATSFNSMAETIERTIEELKLSAERQKDFTASFAHEIKTPMTSVIGYADLIYQGGGLSREKVRSYAGSILNEGMRLESLSQKLMELIVLEKQDFTLTMMPADEVLADVADTVRPVAQSRGISFTLSADRAYFMIEFDLFKTLMLNLIDNSMKSGCDSISVSGIWNGSKYLITVTDNGCGIPADKLNRITEAFYMVDKSRSRRQHGAGLGLKIASEIAAIHGSELRFESTIGEGTSVGFEIYGEDA